MLNLKNKNTLYFKLCLHFSSLIIAICAFILIVIYVVFYYKFNNLFEDKIIDMSATNSEISEVKDDWIIGVNANNITLVEAIHGEEVAKRMYEKSKSQSENSKIYEEEIDGKQLIYNINISEKDGEHIYTYSIIRNIYKEMFPTIIAIITILAVIIIIISIFVVRLICKHLTKNLDTISKYTNKIAYKDWNESIDINTNTEELDILVDSIEHMRDTLKENDKTQQSMLQYISHELKTPIMIISSYTEAIKEDIYPTGNLNSSLDIILDQTVRMEHKVQDLLFITKLDSIDNLVNIDYINLSSTLDKVLNSFKTVQHSNKDIHFDINIDNNIDIHFDKDKLSVLLENMIDNQLRYCENKIIIRSFSYNNTVDILFFNDGESMSIANHDDIFTPFVKGNKGKSGLGLSICKKIVELHKGDIKYIPTKYGCLFKVSFKKINSDFNS